MKRIVLIAAFMAFVTAGNAQEEMTCICKNKANHKTAVKKVVVDKKPCAEDKWVSTYIWNGAIEPCTQRRQNNIVVTECPGVFYDNSDIDMLYEFKSEGAYGGYYPAGHSHGPLAPQHNVIDNYKGVAPAGGHACNHDCAPR